MSGVINDKKSQCSIKKEEKLEGRTVLAMVYGTGKIAKKREWEQKICIITAAAVDAKMMKTKQRCNSKGKIWFQQCILAFLCSGGRTRLGEIISYTFLAPNRYKFQNRQGISIGMILDYVLDHRICSKIFSSRCTKMGTCSFASIFQWQYFHHFISIESD